MAIGTAVLGGMVTSTLLVIFFAPLFYVMIYKALGMRARPAAPTLEGEGISGGKIHE